MLLTPLPLLPQAKKKAASKGQKAALRKGGPGEASALRFDIDEDSDKSVAEQLRDALASASVRVIDLFKDWDDDQSGTVSRKEFHKAMAELEFNVPKEAIDELFAEWDPDGSGALELREIEKQLRRGGEVQLDDKLKARASSLPPRHLLSQQTQGATLVPVHRGCRRGVQARSRRRPRASLRCARA